jgi:hypothetical protein
MQSKHAFKLQEQGLRIRGFSGLVDLGVKYFESMYKEPKRITLAKTFEVIFYFPRMIHEDMLVDIYRLVTIEELEEIMHSYKNKIPSLDGWMMELYIELLIS